MLLLGLGSVAAYRPVGIARKTGYRWHAARGGLPLLRLREAEPGAGGRRGVEREGESLLLFGDDVDLIERDHLPEGDGGGGGEKFSSF